MYMMRPQPWYIQLAIEPQQRVVAVCFNTPPAPIWDVISPLGQPLIYAMAFQCISYLFSVNSYLFSAYSYLLSAYSYLSARWECNSFTTSHFLWSNALSMLMTVCYYSIYITCEPNYLIILRPGLLQSTTIPQQIYHQYLTMLRPFVLIMVVIGCAAVYPPPLSHFSGNGFITLASPCHLHQLDHEMITDTFYIDKVMERLNKGEKCGIDRTLVDRKEWDRLTKISIQSMGDKQGIKDRQVAGRYELQVDENGIVIRCNEYQGYVYALQTLSQLVTPTLRIPYTLIKDGPAVSYRGIMIDSVRHFLPVSSIKLLISSMPLSKLNILHWHISDDETFPVRLGSHPELAESSVYSPQESYSLEDVKDIIDWASKNAVDIVPEIDTPAHVRAWGLAKAWADKNITIKCNGGQGYNGQFDVSKPQSFTIAADVVREIDVLFRNSPYIHLGGDEVSSNCWNLRPQIQTFMKLKNIKSYGQLQMYWRYQLKQALANDRKVMFWRNDGANVTTAGNDILHYWGAQADTAKIVANSTSKIVLSPSDFLYLNKGHGNIWLNATAGDYSTWRQIYENFTLFPAGVDRSRILGAQVCLWGEVSNADTLENNLWMRGTAFAGRVWSEQKLTTATIVKEIVVVQRALYQMGVAASPITSEFCQYKPQVCFPPAAVVTSQE